MRHRSILGLTLSRFAGLMIFLILLVIANSLEINNSGYLHVVGFLNQNIGIIVLFSVLFYLGELFFIFIFPFNLPAPIFSAVGGAFLVNFIFRMFYFIGDVLHESAFSSFKMFEPLIYTLVFFIVLIVGYVNIFVRLRNISRRKEMDRKVYHREMEADRVYEERQHKRVDWKDVGDEFKATAYNVASNIKKSLEPKEEKEKREKEKKKTKAKGKKRKTTGKKTKRKK